MPSLDADDATEGDASSDDGSATQQLQAQRPSQRWVRKRHYKIQEVIKRRQMMLIQVVKEERGNKGAALTTYLSLAGRYCVLMPNTPRGGGISRKITSATDRKRLKGAAASLELPEGMGLIIRTAGANRTKLEIKRDYEYLLRMWDSIRELTLKSNAPACVYEEGDLIKRAIRDLYNKDVSEVIVEGEEGYRNAKDFMRMLMPSHAKNVKQYKETVPLFHKHTIEAQLDAMFSPTVTLKSGGYIVINQTEALVAVDVNSGRATREHNIEDTAYKTNLEAADEVGRQLRLRDLAGLIVIDFIDMEDSRNDRNVEKRLRDAVKTDRARVQIGKISQFGLLEMSRQRLRAGVIAGSTDRLSALRRSGHRALGRIDGAARAARPRGRRPEAARLCRDPALAGRCRRLHAQPEAPRADADRKRLRHGCHLRTRRYGDRRSISRSSAPRPVPPMNAKTAVTIDSVAQVEVPEAEPEQESDAEDRSAQADSERQWRSPSPPSSPRPRPSRRDAGKRAHRRRNRIRCRESRRSQRQRRRGRPRRPSRRRRWRGQAQAPPAPPRPARSPRQ